MLLEAREQEIPIPLNEGNIPYLNHNIKAPII